MSERAVHYFWGIQKWFCFTGTISIPYISLGHNLKHPLLDSEQTGVLWILDSKGSLGISSKHRAPIFSAAFYPNFYVHHF